MILESKEDIQKIKALKLKSEPIIVTGQEKIVMNNSIEEEPATAVVAQIANKGFIKRFVPYYIYKPPFGYPRRDIDLLNCRRLAKTPFVFSVIKTLLDEICSTKWDIIVNPNNKVDEEQIKEKIKQIREFFYNPNGNDESFRTILRQVVRDIFEIDAGVIEKVYNMKGELTQLYSVDGSTILKNPDEYGYMGDRLDYIPVREYSDVANLNNQLAVQQYYTNYLKERAAYFQYNWTGGVWPVPFGKKEIIYIKANDSSDSIYGTSPIQVLYSVILTLVYGAQLNLDMYANNNIPTGILTLMNANKPQMEAVRDYFNAKTQTTDVYGNTIKKWFNIPITTDKAEYIDFKINAKDMQMLEQQGWFLQLVWQTFGVTPDEMGQTNDSNRSTGNEQSRIFKRKALAPIFKLLEYHFNTQIVWELDPQKQVCLKFDDYDIEQEFRKAELNEKLLNTTWTMNEIRIKDNMEKLDGEEYDKPKSMAMAGQFGQGFNGLDRLNSNGNKEDISNEERSPEKDGKLFEKQDTEEPEEDSQTKTKTVEEDVPKITLLEKELKNNYKDLEKKILEMVK